MDLRWRSDRGDRVVLRARSKDPEQRYQTAEELALDVESTMDLATPAEVGQWIDSVAGEILGKRERLLPIDGHDWLAG